MTLEMTAEVVATLNCHLSTEWQGDHAQILRSYIAVAAGQLAALEGPGPTEHVMINIIKALSGGLTA